MKTLRSLFFAQVSMREALAGAEFLLTHEQLDQNLYDCIRTGIITSYARPFGNNCGLSKLGNRFSKFDDAPVQNLHNALLRSRDTIYAHKDFVNEGEMLASDQHRARARPITVHVEPSGDTGWEVQQPHLPKDVTADIVALCRFQEERLKAAADDMGIHLSKGKAYNPGVYTLGEDFP